MSITATVFLRPNGRQEVIELTNVYPEDEAWFKENNIGISMEEDSVGGQVVYGDYGVVEDGEPVEMIVFSKGRSCQDTLKELRQRIEAAKA